MAFVTHTLDPSALAAARAADPQALRAQARQERVLRTEVNERHGAQAQARPTQCRGGSVNQSAAELIRSGGAFLGIEFGSTRIKASLIAPDTTPLASGSHAWENQLEDGVWTYDLEDVWKGVTDCYASLVEDVALEVRAGAEDRRGHGLQRHDARVRRPGSGREAARALPHLAEQHHRQGLRRADPAPRLRRAAAVEHRPPVPVDPRWRSRTSRGSRTSPPWPATSTGSSPASSKMGVGEASGMFPIDPRTGDWDAARMAKFDALIAPRQPRLEAPGHPPRGPPRRPSRREAHRGGREAPRSLGQAPGRHSPLPARGRRGHRHGRHQRRAPAVGERLGRDLGVRDDRAGEEPRPGSTRRSTSWSRPTGSRWPWPTPTTGPPISTPGSPCSARWPGRWAPKRASRTSTPSSCRSRWQGDPDAGGLLSINYVSGEHVTGFTEGRPLFARKPGQQVHARELHAGACYYASLCAMRTGHEHPHRARRGWSSRRSAATAASSRAATPASG